MSKEILLNKLEKQFSYYELVDEIQETINYSKIIEFLDNEKDKKIADLEAKLAESELETARWQEHFEQGKLDYNCLKEELAEKEKEIEKMRYFKVTVGTIESNQIDLSSETYIIQDKIDFAVEQINELKNMLADRAELIDCEQVAEFMFTVYDLEMCSKQLITEIKEGINK